MEKLAGSGLLWNVIALILSTDLSRMTGLCERPTALEYDLENVPRRKRRGSSVNDEENILDTGTTSQDLYVNAVSLGGRSDCVLDVRWQYSPNLLLEDNYAREIKGVARKIKGFFNANRL